MIAFLLAQIGKLKSKIGNVGNTDLQSQINTLSGKIVNGDSIALTSNQLYLTITSQICKSYGGLVYFAIKFTTTEAAENYATLINYGFGVGASYYGQIYKPSTEGFISDCIAYSDYGNTGIRIIGGSLPAGTYIVTGVVIKG